MISETFFCSHYSSVWRSLTPSLEECVRSYNLSEYDRFWPPLPSLSDPSRRGLINEASFIFFCENHNKSKDEIAQNRDELLQQAFVRSSEFLQLELQEVDTVEKREAIAMAARLNTFFSSQSWSGDGALEISTNFAGCGIIGGCRGDVVKGDTLFEVKAGDRKLRSIDFRQLLIYVALRYAETRLIFKKIGVINPRTGVTLIIDTFAFCRDASGLDPYELSERVLASLSANLVSD